VDGHLDQDYTKGTGKTAFIRSPKASSPASRRKSQGERCESSAASRLNASPAVGADHSVSTSRSTMRISSCRRLVPSSGFDNE
jgi:hypothetical protein